MTGRRILCGSVVVLIASIAFATRGPVRAQGPDLGTEAQRESGKTLYLKYCSQCHGEKGDGEGYATPHLSPRPRDFTKGKFKVRITIRLTNGKKVSGVRTYHTCIPKLPGDGPPKV